MPPFALKTEDIKPKKSGRKWRFDYKEGQFETTVWGDTEDQCRQKVINFFGLGPKATVERMDDEKSIGEVGDFYSRSLIELQKFNLCTKV